MIRLRPWSHVRLAGGPLANRYTVEPRRHVAELWMPTEGLWAGVVYRSPLGGSGRLRLAPAPLEEVKAAADLAIQRLLKEAEPVAPPARRAPEVSVEEEGAVSPPPKKPWAGSQCGLF